MSVIVHVAPAPTDMPQVFVSPKSAVFVPPTEMLLILSGLLPTLVSVAVFELLWPTVVAAKVVPVADSFTYVPVPFKGMV